MALLFVAGTEISMSDGSVKKIEDIVIGDSVKSFTYNALSNAFASSSIEVTDIGVGNHEKANIKVVSLSDGKEYITHVNNKFYTINKGDVLVSDLEVDDLLSDIDGTHIAVESITDITEANGLFENTFCGLHTFEPRTESYISVQTILVSND